MLGIHRPFEPPHRAFPEFYSPPPNSFEFVPQGNPTTYQGLPITALAAISFNAPSGANAPLSSIVSLSIFVGGQGLNQQGLNELYVIPGGSIGSNPNGNTSPGQVAWGQGQNLSLIAVFNHTDKNGNTIQGAVNGKPIGNGGGSLSVAVNNLADPIDPLQDPTWSAANGSWVDPTEPWIVGWKRI